MRLFVLVAIFSAVASLQGSVYKKVTEETCPQLQSANTLFEYLLPCATYQTETVEFVCLNRGEISNYLKSVPDWTLANTTTGPAIKRSFEFPDFQQAFLFMAQGAQLAETNQHHPNWSNLYNVVDVTLNTDDQECLSTFDFELAQGMDSIFKLQLQK